MYTIVQSLSWASCTFFFFNKPQAGWTPLFCAVQHDELGSVRLLVAAGANIHDADGIEKTADVYGDDVARATMTGTQPASPRSPRAGDEEE
jgi:hypothetical protein